MRQSAYELLGRTKPIDEHVERLHAIWGNDHEQIRHHLYRAVMSDVRWQSTSDDPEHEAHTAALLAISMATDILREMNVNRPTPASMSGPELQVVLQDITGLIDRDDSAEGSISYAWSDTPGVYEVHAVYRTGNSLGQGGSVIIEGKGDEPTMMDADERTS